MPTTATRIFPTLAFNPGERELLPWLQKAHGRRALLEGSRLVQIDLATGIQPEDPVGVKKGASFFFGATLAALLTGAGVGTLVVCGARTPGCVRATVIDAVQSGFEVLVSADCCADRAEAPHQANLYDMGPKYADVTESQDGAGRRNPAPYSFFEAVAYSPPQVILSSIGRKPDRETGKDSLTHIVETGVFCINIADEADAEAVSGSSAAHATWVDEAALLDLPTESCRAIAGFRLAGAPASLECRLTRHLPLKGEHNHLIVARVEAIHLRDDCLPPDGVLDVTRYHPLTRLGYQDFAAIGAVFQLRRPKV